MADMIGDLGDINKVKAMLHDLLDGAQIKVTIAENLKPIYTLSLKPLELKKATSEEG